MARPVSVLQRRMKPYLGSGLLLRGIAIPGRFILGTTDSGVNYRPFQCLGLCGGKLRRVSGLLQTSFLWREVQELLLVLQGQPSPLFVNVEVTLGFGGPSAPINLMPLLSSFSTWECPKLKGPNRNPK